MGLEHEDVFDSEATAAAAAAERHIVRLRGELVAVKAAREAVKAETFDFMSSAKPSAIGRELSVKSSAAVRDIVSGVSPADWQRARHLLLLARQWGDSADAKVKRASLYSAVRVGDLDSVARIVRRHNAARTADAARWSDAMEETAEYVVEPGTKVDLRAFPANGAPKTGYSLEAQSRFFSKSEVLDRSGNHWLQVAVPPTDDPTTFPGKEVSGNSRVLLGSRVRRGKDWRYGDQDGGVGHQGVITQVLATEVVVKWDGIDEAFRYRSGENGRHDLFFVGAPPPPPQGWLCVRPGGTGSPPIVARTTSALRCFGCGDRLIPPQFGREKFSSVEGKRVRRGDRVLVAATLEPVQVECTAKGRIYCSFLTKAGGEDVVLPSKHTENKNTPVASADGKFIERDVDAKGSAPGTLASSDDQAQLPIENAPSPSQSPQTTSTETRDDNRVCEMEEEIDPPAHAIWYRHEDLVLPKEIPEGEDLDEIAFVKQQMRTRREVVLLCEGDEVAARSAWKEAKRVFSSEEGADFGDDVEKGSFASCARGHLLHARCLQGALLAGRCCPAAGCMEPLWVPSVTRTRNDDDDTCCAQAGGLAEAEALQAASELAGHAAIVAAREDGSGRRERDFTLAGLRELKMCPVCCAGPLFNENCSDMQAHHGECSTSALDGRGSSQSCTPEGAFRVSASDIAARMTQISDSRSVADVLPRCETHNVLVMFNGCMACGHLFTDTSWDDMPSWDPSAKSLLELDKKKRNAARLLAEQVRTEAALLQFERDALWEARGDAVVSAGKGGWSGAGVDAVIEPPPQPTTPMS